jgi:hypothetical protein
MRSTNNYQRKMHRHYRQTIEIMLLVVFVAACTSAPEPRSTPILTVSTSINPPPTGTQFATATNPLPYQVQATEEVGSDSNQDHSYVMEINLMDIQVGDHLLAATLVENSSVDALKEALSQGPITINMRDYGSMEKVGSLGMDLPKNDQPISTEAGDIILFQGNMFVIYYAPNSWNFTRLGKINNVTAKELREILGEGNVTITLSLAHE